MSIIPYTVQKLKQNCPPYFVFFRRWFNSKKWNDSLVIFSGLWYHIYWILDIQSYGGNQYEAYQKRTHLPY